MRIIAPTAGKDDVHRKGIVTGRVRECPLVTEAAVQQAVSE